MGLALKYVNKSTVYLPRNKYSNFHVFGGSVSVRIKRRRAATGSNLKLLTDTIYLKNTAGDLVQRAFKPLHIFELYK